MSENVLKSNTGGDIEENENQNHSKHDISVQDLETFVQEKVNLSGNLSVSDTIREKDNKQEQTFSKQEQSINDLKEACQKNINFFICLASFVCGTAFIQKELESCATYEFQNLFTDNAVEDDDVSKFEDSEKVDFPVLEKKQAAGNIILKLVKEIFARPQNLVQTSANKDKNLEKTPLINLGEEPKLFNMLFSFIKLLECNQYKEKENILVQNFQNKYTHVPESTLDSSFEVEDGKVQNNRTTLGQELDNLVVEDVSTSGIENSDEHLILNKTDQRSEDMFEACLENMNCLINRGDIIGFICGMAFVQEEINSSISGKLHPPAQTEDEPKEPDETNKCVLEEEDQIESSHENTAHNILPKRQSLSEIEINRNEPTESLVKELELFGCDIQDFFECNQKCELAECLGKRFQIILKLISELFDEKELAGENKPEEESSEGELLLITIRDRLQLFNEYAVTMVQKHAGNQILEVLNMLTEDSFQKVKNENSLYSREE